MRNKALENAFLIDDASLQNENDATDIYNLDAAAIAAVPPSILEEKGLLNQYKKDKYITEISYFLIPYEKIVVEKDINAKVALIIASSIDGFSLTAWQYSFSRKYFQNDICIFCIYLSRNKAFFCKRL